jgi:hypothetical protein
MIMDAAVIPPREEILLYLVSLHTLAMGTLHKVQGAAHIREVPISVCDVFVP